MTVASLYSLILDCRPIFLFHIFFFSDPSSASFIRALIGPLGLLKTFVLHHLHTTHALASEMHCFFEARRAPFYCPSAVEQ